jgi:hypothetical protein
MLSGRNGRERMSGAEILRGKSLRMRRRRLRAGKMYLRHRPAPCVYRGYALECVTRGVAQASDVLRGILVLAGVMCQQNIASVLCSATVNASRWRPHHKAAEKYKLRFFVKHTFLIAASGGGIMWNAEAVWLMNEQ